MNFSTKVYKYLNTVIVILIFIGFYYFVWMRIQKEIPRFQSFRSIFPDITIVNGLLYILLFILMCVNWSIEGIKNRFLLSKFCTISFFQSLKTVLVGLSISLLFPNRVGEFLGRAVCMPDKRIETGSAVLIGSFSQMITTLLFGFCGLCLLNILKISILHIISVYLTLFITLFLLFLCLILYFNLNFLHFLLTKIKIKFFHRWLEKLSFIAHYSRKELILILIFSISRYFVFMIQFYILMQLFSVLLSPLYVFIFVSLFYLFLMLLPSWFITEIASRAGIGIFLFTALLPGHDTAIAIISSLLWGINILIPAIVGSFFTLKIKYFGKEIKTTNCV